MKKIIRRLSLRRKIIFSFVMLLAFILLAGVVTSYRLTVSRYTFHTPKIRGPIRLLLIADLHSCYYGKNQSALVEAIETQNPDALMFAGDIADDKIQIGNAERLIEALSGKYPCFYVTGNHEYWSGKAGEIKNIFRSHGVTVLEGNRMPLSVRGEKIIVCGVDDPESGQFNRQLESTANGIETDSCSVLLSHRPELLGQYALKNFDLVLTGHAHGGLWRIPGILKGLIAPNQGFFPKYTSGAYKEQPTTMIVSRGLARESTRIPRLFNSVELVVVDLLPSDE
ncbi:MAG: metallophosphoesterase [Synergistaceae bacterium]|nr:metallophosphoesterase [Synergistaceae bacterium]